MGTTGGGSDRGLPPEDDGRYVTPIRPGTGGAGRWRWLALLAGFLVLVGIIVVQRNAGGTPSAAPVTQQSTTSESGGPPSRTAAAPVPAPSTVPPTTVTVTEEPQGIADDPMITPGPWSTAKPALATSLATSALPKSSGWEIVGYGQQGLVRIDPETGRVWLVDGPEISDESGYQSLVSSGGYTLVMGFGYLRLLVPDAGPARIPLKLLAGASAVLPGPDPAHVWASNDSVGPGGDDVTTIQLVDWQEKATGTTIPLPDYIGPFTAPLPDGDGYVLVRGIGGTYDARPNGLRLVTTGEVIAAGPTGYLAYECGTHPGCGAVSIDRKTGVRRTLGTASLQIANPTSIAQGQMSADGSYAAFVTSPTDPTAGEHVHLVDMTAGKQIVLPVVVDMNNSSGSVFGFSPDGRYLAVATLGGTVDVVDTHTAVVHKLPRVVPLVQSLVTRVTD